MCAFADPIPEWVNGACRWADPLYLRLRVALSGGRTAGRPTISSAVIGAGKPTPMPTSNRKPVPGSMASDLLEDVLDKISELKLDKNEVIDEAFALWLATKST